jgi:1-acyl-sn-glycerol-3-phosphate acyltransferase
VKRKDKRPKRSSNEGQGGARPRNEGQGGARPRNEGQGGARPHNEARGGARPRNEGQGRARPRNEGQPVSPSGAARVDSRSPSNPKRKAHRTGQYRQPLTSHVEPRHEARHPAAPRTPAPVPVEERVTVDAFGYDDTEVDSEEAFELGIGSRVVPPTTQYGEAFESAPPAASEGLKIGDVQAQIRALEARLDGLIRQRDFSEHPEGEAADPVSERRGALAKAPLSAPVLAEAPEPATEDFISRKWGRSALRSRAEQFDDFGLDPSFEQRVKPVVEFLYRSYFRTSVEGIDNVPAEGRCIVVANHSGAVPLDGLMLRAALRIEHRQKRDLRWLAEDFVYYLPFAGVFMNRVGAVRACPENAERLLEKESLVGVFPEGVHGIKKLFQERYRLQRFGRGGYIRLCLRMRAPIVPCAIIGAEESSPLLYRLEGLTELLGLPYFPITPTFPFLGPAGLLPAPTKWRMRFGEPINLDNYGPEAADDHVLVGRLSERVRSAIQAMLDSGLRERRSVWFG